MHYLYLLTYRHVDERFDPINGIVRWQFDEIFHHNLELRSRILFSLFEC